MTVTQTSTLSNSLRIQYLNDYVVGAAKRRFYDIVASPIDELSAAAGAAQSMADRRAGPSGLPSSQTWGSLPRL